MNALTYAQIPIHHHEEFDWPDASGDVLEGILATATLLMGADSQSFRQAIASVVLRAMETRILSDPKMRVLSKKRSQGEWLGAEVAVVLRVITASEPSPELVEYVAARLRALSSRSQGAGTKPLPQDTESRIMRLATRDFTDASLKQLRCRICGHWFGKDDLDPDRSDGSASAEKKDRLAAALLESEIYLAPALHDERSNDPLKPPNNRKGSWTFVTVDHKIPKEGGGSDDDDNLELTCRFCNAGKSIYRYPFEAISTAVAGSLNVLKHSMPRQIAVVSALRAADGRCRSPGCVRTIDDAELTVVLAPLDGPIWTAPWNLRVRCYECAKDDLNSMRERFSAETL